MKSEKKKRVYYEDIKARHTTHWDMDYLRQAELEALYDNNRRQSVSGGREAKGLPRRKILITVLAVSTTALLALLFVLLFRSFS